MSRTSGGGPIGDGAVPLRCSVWAVVCVRAAGGQSSRCGARLVQAPDRFHPVHCRLSPTLSAQLEPTEGTLWEVPAWWKVEGGRRKVLLGWTHPIAASPAGFAYFPSRCEVCIPRPSAAEREGVVRWTAQQAGRQDLHARARSCAARCGAVRQCACLSNPARDGRLGFA
jgi:hypothetical protein